MKATLTEFISVLSKKDRKILEDLLSNKYRKFTKLFYLVKDYTDSIDKLKYNFSSKEVLNVDVIFSKKVSIELKKELLESMEENGYIVDYTLGEKKLKMVITYDEDKL